MINTEINDETRALQVGRLGGRTKHRNVFQYIRIIFAEFIVDMNGAISKPQSRDRKGRDSGQYRKILMIMMMRMIMMER